MSVEDNKALARRVITAFNAGDVSTSAAMLTDDVEYRLAGYPVVHGREQFAKFVREIKRSFPDFTFTIEDVVAEDDKVAFRFVATGTHRGALQGIPPTNKPFGINGLAIAQIVDGKVSRLWEVIDRFDQLRQLGLIPA
jgi:steroid delta-isomerase-like uncharacterized protein